MSAAGRPPTPAPGAPSHPGSGRPFPWDEALAFGFGVLRLPPDAVWAMTPRELAAAWRAHAPPRAEPLDGPALAALMAAFPD